MKKHNTIVGSTFLSTPQSLFAEINQSYSIQITSLDKTTANMHLLKSFVVFGMTFPTTLMATEYISFHNEVDWAGGVSKETIELDECRAIPNSNATGDCGSSVEVRLLALPELFSHHPLPFSTFELC